MKLLTLKCPSCGGHLSIEEDRDFIFCQYCGTKIIIDRDNEFTYRHIDEADVKRAETERIVKLKELEFEKENRGNQTVSIVVCLIALVFVFAIVMVLILSGIRLVVEGNDDPGAGLIMFGMLAGGASSPFIIKLLRTRRRHNTSYSSSSSQAHSGEHAKNNVNPKNGANLKYNMALNANEALYGVTKNIQIKKDEICKMCSGKGFINTTRCNQCEGSGKRRVLKPLTVTIPAGVETGQMIIVKGEGDPGMYGGSNGDLYIDILVR